MVLYVVNYSYVVVWSTVMEYGMKNRDTNLYFKYELERMETIKLIDNSLATRSSKVK